MQPQPIGPLRPSQMRTRRSAFGKESGRSSTWSAMENVAGFAVHDVLGGKRVTLTAAWEHDEAADDPFALRIRTLLLANKADTIERIDAELETFRELTGLRYPALCVSALTGHGLDALGPWLFRALGIVRVYTKAQTRAGCERDDRALHQPLHVDDDVVRLLAQGP